MRSILAFPDLVNLTMRGDTFSVPCWTRFEHTAAADAQLFSMLYAPLMRFYRF